MRRLPTWLAMGFFLAVAAVMPAPANLDPDPAAEIPLDEEAGSSGYFNCPWSLRDDLHTSNFALVSAAPTPFRISYFANGRAESGPVGSLAAGGGISLPNTRVIGVTPALAEMSGSPSAAAVTSAGERLLAGYLCPEALPGVRHLPGGSTEEGESLTLYLLNPFTEDARVSLRIFSEFGAEADRDLEALNVPARRVRRFAMHELFPGRRSLAALVEQVSGLVVPVMAWQTPEDGAAWPGMSAHESWEFPAAGIAGADTGLVLANEALIEVTVDMEVFDAAGSLLETRSYAVPGPGLATIPLAEVEVSDFGVRLTGDLPFSAALTAGGGPAVAAAAGARWVAEEWLVPGPGTAPADFKLRILNTGVSDIAVSVRRAGGGAGGAETISVPAGSLATADIAAGSSGLLVSGDGTFSAAWWAEDERGRIMLGEASPAAR